MKNRILFYFVTMVLVLVSINCGRNIDGLARVEQTLSGTVELGSPVVGAHVTAYTFKQLERGEELGTAITDEKGDFKIEHHHPYRGPVMLVASNGSFLDPATKIQMFLPTNFTLKAGVWDSGKMASSNINALTTLAAGWTESEVQKSRVKNGETTDSNHIALGIFNMSVHFRVNPSLKFDETAIWDYSKETLAPSEARALVYLVHAGLSQMAKNFSKQTNQEPGAITVFSILSALMQDAQDGTLDGIYKQNPIFIDNGKQIVLDSYFMRNKLAIAIQLFLNDLKASNINIGFDGSSFAAKGGFYEQISIGDWVAGLFEKLPSAIPFDTAPPEIKMGFAGKYAGEMSGERLSGDVTIEATAVDKVSGLKSFRIIEPVDFESTSTEDGKLAFVVTPSMMPNVNKAVKACGFDYGNLNVGLGNIFENNEAVCLCLEARDVLDNVSHKIRCVRRPPPQAKLTWVANRSTLSTETFKFGTAVFNGEVHSGYGLLSCGWQVSTLDGSTKVGEIELPWGNGLIKNTECSFGEVLKQELLPDGDYKISLFATDLMGHEIASAKSYYQETFAVHKTPPVIAVTSPEAEIRTNSSKIDLIGTVKSGVAIRDVYVEMVQGQWNESKPKRIYYGVAHDGGWSLRIDELPEAVACTYVVHAVDIYGNHSQLAPRLIVVDRQPPTILGHRDGIAQGHFAQEHSTTSVYRSGIPGLPQFQFKANGTQSMIPWDSVPVIYRWASQLNDEKSAPSYSIQVEDDSGIKEVRWVHGTECLPLNQAKNIAELIDGKATLRLSSSTAKNELDAATNENQNRCLSVWAIDNAGNAKNHQVNFRWHTVAPPIVVDFNSPLYDPAQSSDDMAFHKNSVSDAYYLAERKVSKEGYVIAHAILHNPHSIDLDFKLEDNSNPEIELKLKETVFLGQETVEKDWVYNGLLAQTDVPGTPGVPNPDWQKPERLWNRMHPSGPSGNPRKIIYTEKYNLLSNPRSHSNLAAKDKICYDSQPSYNKICGPDEVIVFGKRNSDLVEQNRNPDNQKKQLCTVQEVECLPSSHRYWAVNKRDTAVFAVGEQIEGKESTVVKSSKRYFSFDSATNQVQQEVFVSDNKVRIPAGKTLLAKFYLEEQGIKAELRNLDASLITNKVIGECKDILYSTGDANTCKDAGCKRDKVCSLLAGVQLRLRAKVSPQKKGIGILAQVAPSPFKYSTQTDAGAISDDSVPVTLESPISRSVTR